MQVFINLLTNAVKYSPGGKRVIVRVVESRGKVPRFDPGFRPRNQESRSVEDLYAFLPILGGGGGEVGGSGGVFTYLEGDHQNAPRTTQGTKCSVGKGPHFLHIAFIINIHHGSN